MASFFFFSLFFFSHPSHVACLSYLPLFSVLLADNEFRRTNRNYSHEKKNTKEAFFLAHYISYNKYIWPFIQCNWKIKLSFCFYLIKVVTLLDCSSWPTRGKSMEIPWRYDIEKWQWKNHGNIMEVWYSVISWYKHGNIMEALYWQKGDNFSQGYKNLTIIFHPRHTWSDIINDDMIKNITCAEMQ